MMSHAWTPIHHPWFNKPSMKRKLSSSPSPPAKRRRAADLERGFANLTLDISPPNTDPHGSSASIPPPNHQFPLDIQDDLAMDADLPPVPVPVPMLEPERDVSSPTPDQPFCDVKMKASTWYEPEPDRIIITSLDSPSSSEDEEELEVEVSPLLLERLKERTRIQTISPPEQSQALILFRPLPFSPSPSTASPSDEEEQPQVPVNDDAMEVES